MSNLALTWAWDQQVPDYAAKLLLIKLADQANDDGECWPSRKTLCDQIGCDERAMKRKLRMLESLGLLSYDSRFRENGSQQSNVYHLPVGGSVNPPPRALQTPPGGVVEPPLEPTVEPGPSYEGPSATPKPRKPNLIWDACVVIWGQPANDVERTRRARAVKLFRQAFQTDGIEESEAVAEIKRRYERYAERYDQIALPSDIALASRWSDSKPVLTIAKRY